MTTQELYTIGDVSRKLGVPRHRIAYLLESGRAQESLRLGGRRVFTEKDLALIAQGLHVAHASGREDAGRGSHANR
jgi:DNA-binding transcriptional MerR regulator